MWAVVGLGNPGRKYLHTRHNIGFVFIKNLAKKWKVRLKKRRYSSKIVEVKRKNDRILLVMPQTFMNLSGVAVKQIIETKGISPENMVIVYDDLDLYGGEIRIKKGGSAGTHRGMNSIIQELNNTNFLRIRIGIGPMNPGIDATDYVLAPFEEEENILMKESIEKALKALEMILDGDAEGAMNEFNQRKKIVDVIN